MIAKYRYYYRSVHDNKARNALHRISPMSVPEIQTGFP